MAYLQGQHNPAQALTCHACDAFVVGPGGAGSLWLW
jgi:hypothetical protein